MKRARISGSKTRIVPDAAVGDGDLEIVAPTRPLRTLDQLEPVELESDLDVDRLLRESRGDR